MKAIKILPKKELVIFVPSQLPQREIDRIKARLGEVKVRFKIDPDLIGGAALAWDGQYKDYSLKARFEEKKKELEAIYKLV